LGLTLLRNSSMKGGKRRGGEKRGRGGEKVMLASS